jgi:hypothetical protein
MSALDATNLTYDPVHGYIPFTSGAGLAADEVSERQIIDDPWVQRLRHIHQLQTAWWVYLPSTRGFRTSSGRCTWGAGRWSDFFSV